MKVTAQIASQSYTVDLGRPMDISIPIHFNGAQPNTYGVPIASAQAYEDGNFVGDTRRGGSCNFEEYRLIPHCNGTHTECVGHLALERISVHETLKNSFIPCTLVSIEPVAGDASDEACSPQQPGDRLLTEALLRESLRNVKPGFLSALVVRTLPNQPSKKSQKYRDYVPPYFTLQAMEYVVHSGVKHLLVDVPSVDRTLDEGRMSTHRVFWNVPQGSHEVDKNAHSLNTITEMIYVPDEIADGSHLLNLQIPSFVADAAPSRPLLFEV